MSPVKKLLMAAIAVALTCAVAGLSAQDSQPAKEAPDLRVVFDVPEEAKAPFEKATVEVLRFNKQSGEREVVESQSFTKNEFTVEFDGIEEGDYAVFVYTGEKDSIGDAGQPGAFYYGEQVSVADNETQTVRVEYIPFEPESLQGNATVSAKLLTLDDSPRSNLDIKLVKEIQNVGLYEAATGTTSESGMLEVSGLKEGEQYLVALGNDMVAGRVTAGSGETKEFRVPPMKGDSAPAVAFSDLYEDTKHSLEDYKGKVVVVDFWATWCPPCQPAMEKYDKLAVEKKEAWGDDVKLLAVSVDAEKSLAEKHIEKKGWTNLSHGWTGQGGGGLDDAFAVTSIPTTFVIGKDGRIAERGHPMALDLEKLVEEQLQ